MRFGERQAGGAIVVRARSRAGASTTKRRLKLLSSVLLQRLKGSAQKALAQDLEIPVEHGRVDLQLPDTGRVGDVDVSGGQSRNLGHEHSPRAVAVLLDQVRRLPEVLHLHETGIERRLLLLLAPDLFPGLGSMQDVAGD